VKAFFCGKALIVINKNRIDKKIEDFIGLYKFNDARKSDINLKLNFK
jgi:hypothetical protein